MSVGSSTSACRIKRRASTTLRPASLSPRPKIFRTTCAETRDCGGIRGDAPISRRENDRRKETRTWEKRVRREKTEKKDVDWTNDFFFPCADSRFSETASRTRRERRNTRPLTWHTKRRQAEQLAAFRETEERRCRDWRVATRCCSRKVKKKRCRRRARARSALDATPLGTRVRRRRTSRPDHARTCAPRRGKGWHRLALDPRASFARHDPRTSRRVLAGIFLNHEQETGRGRRPRR